MGDSSKFHDNLTGLGKKLCPRLGELVPQPEVGSRNLGIELLPNTVHVRSVKKMRKLVNYRSAARCHGGLAAEVKRGVARWDQSTAGWGDRRVRGGGGGVDGCWRGTTRPERWVEQK